MSISIDVSTAFTFVRNMVSVLVRTESADGVAQICDAVAVAIRACAWIFARVWNAALIAVQRYSQCNIKRIVLSIVIAIDKCWRRNLLMGGDPRCGASTRSAQDVDKSRWENCGLGRQLCKQNSL